MQNTKVILQDPKDAWQKMLPLTYTKPISALRIGIDTIQQKWEAALDCNAEIDTESYLIPKFQNKQGTESSILIINATIIPTKELIQAILNLTSQQSLEKGEKFIARKIESEELPVESITFEGELIEIKRPWDLFLLNDTVFRLDFERITKGRTSQPIPKNNQIANEVDIFLEEGASVEFSVLDARKGPIYIGKNASIMAGCLVQGGLALCESATLKMGAKHYGTSTIGPHSKIGGEVGNIVVQAYSNKGHDGFLGNAVLGEWCNLGADTNASNLKNNYSPIIAFSYHEGKLIDTGQQFIGLIMGDHSKCAINTMFNTATVVGVAANIFGAGFPKKHIPSFLWGGVEYNRTFQISKSFEMAELMMKRRNIKFTTLDKQIFETIFETTKKYRPS